MVFLFCQNMASLNYANQYRLPLFHHYLLLGFFKQEIENQTPDSPQIGLRPHASDKFLLLSSQMKIRTLKIVEAVFPNVISNPRNNMSSYTTPTYEMTSLITRLINTRYSKVKPTVLIWPINSSNGPPPKKKKISGATAKGVFG